MSVRLNGVAVAIIALAAVGCGERNQTLPPGPSMQASAPVTTGLTCDFKSLNQLATHYFGGTEAKAVRDVIAAMQTAGGTTATGRDRGFDVMTHIASNVNAGNSDVADAGALTNGLLVCMYTSADELPRNFPEDFSVAVNPALHGGYAVRGSSVDPLTDPVLSRPFSAPFSGVATPGTTTWPDMLSANPQPHRLLVYGMPGSFSTTYDWRVVPRNSTFSPKAIVGVCIDPNTNATSLLHEEHTGLLPFVEAGFLNPATCGSLASRSFLSDLASRVGRWGVDLFGPRSLSATTLMGNGGLGGSTGGIGSEFGPQLVSTVTLTFTAQPTDVTVNQIITPPVVVQATDAATGDPVPNVVITLTSVNNNGTPAQLLGTLTGTTDATGTVTFVDLSETKTGAYTLVANGGVVGRPAIGVPAGTSVRFNVRP
jgi:hypothetical protein